MIELLGEKDYDEITVKEIAERAEVGTMTFYRHYADKNALTQVIEAKVFAQIQDLLEPPVSLAAIERVTRRLLRYVQDNPDVFRAVGKTRSMNGIIQQLSARSLADINQLFPGNEPKPTGKAHLLRELAASHLVYAQFNLIRWWSQNDYALSIDEMVSLILELVMLPIVNLSSRATSSHEGHVPSD